MEGWPKVTHRTLLPARPVSFDHLLLGVSKATSRTQREQQTGPRHQRAGCHSGCGSRNPWVGLFLEWGPGASLGYHRFPQLRIKSAMAASMAS